MMAGMTWRPRRDDIDDLITTIGRMGSMCLTGQNSATDKDFELEEGEGVELTHAGHAREGPTTRPACIAREGHVPMLTREGRS